MPMAKFIEVRVDFLMKHGKKVFHQEITHAFDTENSLPEQIEQKLASWVENKNKFRMEDEEYSIDGILNAVYYYNGVWYRDRLEWHHFKRMAA